jgi:FkbM family methyltransferase
MLWPAIQPGDQGVFGWSRSRQSPEERAYKRLHAKGFSPAGIIDVGAYHGDWTKLVRRVFSAPVLMVEAQKAKRPKLEAMCGKDVRLASCVLGAEAGKLVTFYEMETGSSYFPEKSNAPRSKSTYLTETLDTVAAGMSGPLFLKIDTQGSELEVLKGGQATLDRCEVVQLEVALLPYNEGAPTFLEVITYMDERGFVPLDVSGFSRPNLVDLVQIDILFVRRDSSLRPATIEFEWHKRRED